jgi:hypothetical protein
MPLPHSEDWIGVCVACGEPVDQSALDVEAFEVGGALTCQACAIAPMEHVSGPIQRALTIIAEGMK